MDGFNPDYIGEKRIKIGWMELLWKRNWDMQLCWMELFHPTTTIKIYMELYGLKVLMRPEIKGPQGICQSPNPRRVA